MQDGSCGFVLPKHQNLKYIDIDNGMHFGVIDIIASLINEDDCLSEILDNWISKKEKLKRHFTILSDGSSHLLTLSIESLNRMKFDFLDTYETFFRDGLSRLKKAFAVKVMTAQKCL